MGKNLNNQIEEFRRILRRNNILFQGECNTFIFRDLAKRKS